MERMVDYKPQERQDLEELYRKQNVRIYELEEENKKLKEENEKLKEELETRVNGAIDSTKRLIRLLYFN